MENLSGLLVGKKYLYLNDEVNLSNGGFMKVNFGSIVTIENINEFSVSYNLRKSNKNYKAYSNFYGEFVLASKKNLDKLQKAYKIQAQIDKLQSQFNSITFD